MTNSNAPRTPRDKSGGSFGRYVLALVPLALFAGFAIVAGKMLYEQDIGGKDISAIPSALIGKQAPALDMKPLEGSRIPALSNGQIAGKLTLINIFASWCIPCRQEHPILKKLSADTRLNVVGINYKDNADNALRFLGELGNPYSAIGVDKDGTAVIDWGVYGIPETYLVGADGTVLYKKVGPLDDTSLRNGLLPAIEKALAGHRK